MNLLAGLTAADDLLKKLNKLLTGVPHGSLTLHLAGLGVERCVERERSVALVFKAMPPLGPSGRQWQYAVATVQRLNGGLFVNAEDGGMVRLSQIDCDDVGRLTLEVGIGGGHVAFETMGPQVSFAPDAMNQIFADA